MKKLLAYNFVRPWKETFLNHSTPSTLMMVSKMNHQNVSIMNDRFNILNKDCEYNLLETNTDINHIKKLKQLSFKECCQKRAEEIILFANKQDKDIYVYWSGGVDSTCIVCSFLMNTRLNRNRFHLIFGNDSIEEYPLFYRRMKDEHIDVINVGYDILKLQTIVGDNIAVSGKCGDQLDGYNSTRPLFKGIDPFLDWKDAIKLWRGKEFGYSNIDRLISDSEMYAKYFDITLKYFGDFYWLFAFSLLWTWNASYIKSLHINPNNSFVFYDTDYFSNYGLFYFHKRRTSKQISSYTYKTDWKKVIYEYTKDEDYFLNKGKYSPLFFNIPEAWFGMNVIDEDGYHLYNDFSPYVVKTIMYPYIKDEYKHLYCVYQKGNVQY